MSEWQDIATAPKDGTPILVYGTPDDLVMNGDVLLSFKRHGIHLARWDSVDQAFCLDGGSWLGPFIEPSHWCALPNPPKGS